MFLLDILPDTAVKEIVFYLDEITLRRLQKTLNNYHISKKLELYDKIHKIYWYQVFASSIDNQLTKDIENYKLELFLNSPIWPQSLIDKKYELLDKAEHIKILLDIVPYESITIIIKNCKGYSDILFNYS